MFQIVELRKRVLLTLSLLAVYRIGVFVTLPGVDRGAMVKFMQGQQNSFLGLFNMFSGGAIEQLSVFALGIMPYISASIIFQLLTVVVPTLDRLNKEGEQGRKKINQWTRYATIALSVVQGFFIALYLENLNAQSGTGQIVHYPGTFGFRFMTVLTLTTGSAFIMWLGEQITERGIGNGMSLIIFAGIVAGLPNALFQTQQMLSSEQMSLFELIALGGIVFGVIAVIVFVERGQRQIPVQYAKRLVGNRVGAAQSTHLPLRVNMAGVIPPIFASSILMFPTMAASWTDATWLQSFLAALTPGHWVYMLVFSLLIIFFCFFYTSVMFNPVDVAENLKKYGGYIPGIRPGTKTAEYIDHVLTRLTFGGAIYVAAVCLLPMLIQDQFAVSFYFGGTSLLIIVSVALDTVQQIESHLITRNYEGFTDNRGPRIRSRRGATVQ
ncbi:MAG: preprotein translocase subunit SecY [Myxococcales bacterium]|nr:preprotein translocase subunit SecY [Myxococcales bacterium]